MPTHDDQDPPPDWNDTWAGTVTPEEQARARALLGLALEGGTGTDEAVREWAETRRRAGHETDRKRRGDERGARAGERAGRRDGGDQAGERDHRERAGARDDGRRADGLDDREDAAWRGDGPESGSGSSTGGRSGRRGRKRRSGEEADAGTKRRERRTGPAQIDPNEDPEAQARAICLRQLTGQARTRAQLADALKKRGVPDDVADHVLGRFTEVKLIDDAAFAAAWVDTRHLGRGLARRALAQELRQRGVDPDLVTEAVDRLDPDQERETARALVARRLPGTRRLDRQSRTRRLAGMLARKGYPEGLALRVVREALDEDEAAAAEEAAERHAHLGEPPADPTSEDAPDPTRWSRTPQEDRRRALPPRRTSLRSTGFRSALSRRPGPPDPVPDDPFDPDPYEPDPFDEDPPPEPEP